MTKVLIIIYEKPKITFIILKTEACHCHWYIVHIHVHLLRKILLSLDKYFSANTPPKHDTLYICSVYTPPPPYTCIWYICSWLHLINILDFDQLIVCAVFDYFYIEWNSFNFTSAWSMRISLCIPRCLGICQNPVQAFAFFTPASLNLPKSLDRYLLQSSLSKHDKAM